MEFRMAHMLAVILTATSQQYSMAAVAHPRQIMSTTTASPLLITEVTVKETNNVTLPCPRLPTDKRIVFWTHYILPGPSSNRTLLFVGPSDLTKNPRFSVLAGSSLHISSVKATDGGFFACAFPNVQPLASYRLVVQTVPVNPTTAPSTSVEHVAVAEPVLFEKPQFDLLIEHRSSVETNETDVPSTTKSLTAVLLPVVVQIASADPTTAPSASEENVFLAGPERPVMLDEPEIEWLIGHDVTGAADVTATPSTAANGTVVTLPAVVQTANTPVGAPLYYGPQSTGKLSIHPDEVADYEPSYEDELKSPEIYLLSGETIIDGKDSTDEPALGRLYDGGPEREETYLQHHSASFPVSAAAAAKLTAHDMEIVHVAPPAVDGVAVASSSAPDTTMTTTTQATTTITTQTTSATSTEATTSTVVPWTMPPIAFDLAAVSATTAPSVSVENVTIVENLVFDGPAVKFLIEHNVTVATNVTEAPSTTKNVTLMAPPVVGVTIPVHTEPPAALHSSSPVVSPFSLAFSFLMVACLLILLIIGVEFFSLRVSPRHVNLKQK